MYRFTYIHYTAPLRLRAPYTRLFLGDVHSYNKKLDLFKFTLASRRKKTVCFCLFLSATYCKPVWLELVYGPAYTFANYSLDFDKRTLPSFILQLVGTFQPWSLFKALSGLSSPKPACFSGRLCGLSRQNSGQNRRYRKS